MKALFSSKKYTLDVSSNFVIGFDEHLIVLTCLSNLRTVARIRISKERKPEYNH